MMSFLPRIRGMRTLTTTLKRTPSASPVALVLAVETVPRAAMQALLGGRLVRLLPRALNAE